jgi:hypothetical protein
MLNRFSSSAKKLNRVIPKINSNNLAQSDLTGSLMNIEMPNNKKFESQNRSNPTPTRFVNNKNIINNFHSQIFEYSVRYNKKLVDLFDIINNKLIIKNVSLDYGTEDVTPDNFEIFVGGLHIPGNFNIKQIGNDVIITLYDDYIDFINTLPSDIYVFGKFVDITLNTETSFNLLTEEGDEIII